MDYTGYRAYRWKEEKYFKNSLVVGGSDANLQMLLGGATRAVFPQGIVINEFVQLQSRISRIDFSVWHSGQDYW